MDIADAVRYRLLGKSMDCSKCRHFATLHMPEKHLKLCALNDGVIKTDLTMCPEFHRNRDTAISVRYTYCMTLMGNLTPPGAYPDRTEMLRTNAAMSPVVAKLLHRKFRCQ